MHTAAVPSCPPSVPSMPRRRREIRTRPDIHSRQGRFLAEVVPEGLRIPHKQTGQEHVVTLREIVEAAADVGQCSPRELIDWLSSQFPTTDHSGPASGPDHSTESGYGRRDIA